MISSDVMVPLRYVTACFGSSPLIDPQKTNVALSIDCRETDSSWPAADSRRNVRGISGFSRQLFATGYSFLGLRFEGNFLM